MLLLGSINPAGVFGFINSAGETGIGFFNSTGFETWPKGEVFNLFLASFGTCAGIYIQGFCEQRGIPFEEIKILHHLEYNFATGIWDC